MCSTVILSECQSHEGPAIQNIRMFPVIALWFKLPQLTSLDKCLSSEQEATFPTLARPTLKALK